MSIAQKLTTVAENQQKVFEAGRNAVINELKEAQKRFASGEIIAITDISPVEHNLSVQLSDANATLTVLGRNLIDADAMVNNEFVKNKDGSYTFTKTDNSSKRYTEFIKFNEPIPSGTQLCFSVDRYEGEAMKEVGIQLQYTDDTYYSSYAIKPSGMYVSFKADKAIKGIRLYISQTIADGTSVILYGLQLKAGSKVAGYEPYIEPAYYTPNADGTVEGVKSIYPTTTLATDTSGVLIECEYIRDLNGVVDELTDAIISLGGDI